MISSFGRVPADLVSGADSKVAEMRDDGRVMTDLDAGHKVSRGSARIR